jgi:nucleoside-diphosphate-sugar epimerase
MTEIDYERFQSWWDDPTIRAWNLWGYVDACDVAHAVQCSLTAPARGAEAFLIAASDTCMTRPYNELLAEVYPMVPTTRPVNGHETLLSIDKARSMLGYQPQHTWRDHIQQR